MFGPTEDGLGRLKGRALDDTQRNIFVSKYFLYFADRPGNNWAGSQKFGPTQRDVLGDTQGIFFVQI